MMLYCIYANNCTERYNRVLNRDKQGINYISVELNIIYIYLYIPHTYIYIYIYINIPLFYPLPKFFQIEKLAIKYLYIYIIIIIIIFIQDHNYKSYHNRIAIYTIFTLNF